MKVAVIDIGAARTKLTIAEKQGVGSYHFVSSSIETRLGGLLADGLVEGGASVLRSGVEASVAAATREGAEKLVVIGTQAFRDSARSCELAKVAETIVGQFTVISPEMEAALFYHSVEIEELASAFCAADIGGGSVQVVWGANAGEGGSAPFGTYALENKFQPDKSVAVLPAGPEYENMKAEAAKQLRPFRLSERRATKLFIGSNVMKDFFSAALRNSGINPHTLGEFSDADVAALAAVIGGKPYQESYYLYPDNKGFLHGADKLLAIVASVMEQGEFSRACGTNASVSKGVCELLIERPERLESIGAAGVSIRA